ncbi:MAG: hypothetical protein ABI867_17800 [Kofleriaceae bacterium]
MIRVVVLLAIVLAAHPAAADKATADAAAAAAEALDKAEDFRGAAVKFAEAAKADPSNPDHYCNIGISYFKADDFARAHLILNRCLDRGTRDAAFTANVRAAITDIETALRAKGHAPITVTAEPSNASVAIVEWGADDEAFVGTRVVWLPFGTFHLRGRSTGFADETVEVVVTGQEPRSVALTLKPAIVEKPKPKPKKPSGPPSKLLPIATSLLTVGGVVLAVIAHGKAADRAEIAPTRLDPDVFADDKSYIDRWNAITVTSVGVGIVGAGLSAYLWLRVIRAPKASRMEVTPTAGGAAVSFSRSF